MIADEFADHLASDSSTLSLVTGVRPIAKGLDDEYPYIVYETVNMTNHEWLNSKSNLHEGVVRFSVVALTQGECRDLAERIKEFLRSNQSYTGAEYDIRRSRLEEEEDVAQVLDDNERPLYFVKTLDYWLRARKL